jgi:hypothetical protein
LRHKSINNIIINTIDPLNFTTYGDLKNNFNKVYFNVPIYIFIHFCPKSNDNITHLNIINEQISALINTGLYDKCDKIYYGCNCDNCDIFLEKYLETLSYLYRYKFIKMNNAICPKIKSYENNTINSMLDIAKKSDKHFFGLYIHTKGTTAISITQHTWRQIMMYWLVDKYKICIDILSRGFNTIGIFYSPYPKKHYSGNFFWFDSEYLKKLNFITNTTDRMEAEFFIMKGYEKDKHITLLKERYISEINVGLYYFHAEIKDSSRDDDIDLAII